MVQSFAPAFSSGYGDVQVAFYTGLPNEIIKASRP
jgi:hypothetical protein